MDGRRDPRLSCILRLNWITNLCHLGGPHYKEAEALLREVRPLVIASRKELDLLRVVWLGAKIATGLGKKEEARAGFEQVRRDLVTRQMPCDCALVTLELAVLLLELGRHTEVKTLAAESVFVLRAHGIRREAVAAIRVFCTAAEKEELTLGLARRILNELERMLKSSPEQRPETRGVRGR